MRSVFLLTAFASTALFAAEPSPEALKLKARAALALVAPSRDCGNCQHDEDAARTESLRERKPLVLIVGPCAGRGRIAIEAGGIACLVSNYSRDGKPATESRLVVLKPLVNEFEPVASLAPDASDADVKAAVEKAKRPWAVYKWVCRDGKCSLEEVK